MEPQEAYLEKLERARRRVKELKGFYNHLKAFIIINILLFIVIGGILDFISINGKPLDLGFYDWRQINFVLTPTLWGIGLLIHGLCVYRYKFTFFREWEKKQIQKYMNEDRRQEEKYK